MKKHISQNVFMLLFTSQLKEKISYYWGIVGFLLATAILLIEYFVNAMNCYLDGGGITSVFSSSFSFLHHPSYTLCFLVFAMVLLVYAWKKKLKGFKLTWVIPSLLFLFVSSILCLSLAGILFLFLLIGVVLLVLIYKKWGKLATVLAAIITPLALYFTLLTIPQVEGEWTGAKWYANEYLKDSEAFVQQRKYPMSGTEVRLVMWTVSLKSVKQISIWNWHR